MATSTGVESLNMMLAADVKVQGADTVRGPMSSPSVFIPGSCESQMTLCCLTSANCKALIMGM